MILKGSQRGGAHALARHLLRRDENDHIEVLELRGFVSKDLAGALSEAYGTSKGTRCEKYLFSLSLNPPTDGGATIAALLDAVEQAETTLGLSGQPRAVVLHEKNARIHAHAVWSRIDARTMKAVPLPFFKTRLAELSKDLYLQRGWELPDGHKENGWKSPLNFTLAEWQQAKRIDLDPRELKQLFREAWGQSDSLHSLRNALTARGYYLARGDRRGFVAVDMHGEVYSLARMLGLPARDVRERLGTPEGLPSVEEVKAHLGQELSRNVGQALRESRSRDRIELMPLRVELRTHVVRQRALRRRLIAPERPVGCDSVATHSAPGDEKVSFRGPPTRGRSARRKRELLITPRDHHSRERSAPSLFIRGQLPGESWDHYAAYRRSCDRMIQEQLDARADATRKIAEAVARQRASRRALIDRLAELMHADQADAIASADCRISPAHGVAGP